MRSKIAIVGNNVRQLMGTWLESVPDEQVILIYLPNAGFMAVLSILINNFIYFGGKL